MKLPGYWIPIICILILGLTAKLTGGSIRSQTKLYHHLLRNDDHPYETGLVPKCNESKPVELHIDIAFRQLISLEEKAQIMTSNVWIRTNWHDCRLEWNASDHSGVNHLTVPYGETWLPDLTLYDSAAEEEMMPGRDSVLIMIKSTGDVHYNLPTVLKSVCLVRVAYFPYDVQECTLKFGSWVHVLDDLDIINVNPEGDLSSFVKNNEWDIISFQAQRHVRNFTAGDYPDVRFTLKMKRRPQFYLMTMLFPCILVSAMAMIGFLLPAESGEKISLEVTVLLSLAVFLLVISDFLPPSADTFPIIGTYYAAAMLMVSVSLVLSVLVLNVHHRGESGRKVPSWARKLFYFNTCSKQSKYATRSCNYTNWESSSSRSSGSSMKSKIQDSVNHLGNNQNTQPPSDIERLMSEQIDALRKVSNHLDNKDYSEELCDEWRALARILDRIFLVVYIILSVVISLVFLIPLNYNDQ